VIAPVVGFDTDYYRLGYGRGFFDRTLAVLPATTVAIGAPTAGNAHPSRWCAPDELRPLAL
jgi:5-formyltetrahydrofolate cyclo-ligase